MLGRTIAVLYMMTNNQWFQRYQAETLSPYKILENGLPPLTFILLDRANKCAQLFFHMS